MTTAGMTTAEGSQPETDMMRQARSDTRFFRNLSWVVLAFVILAFGGKAVLNSASLPPLTPMHHLHAVSMLGWFALVAVQASLIDTGRHSLHRTLGRLSPLLVIAFIVFACFISQMNWDRVGDPLITTANALFMCLFVGFYVAGVLQRRNTATHRRLMVFASLSFVGPAAGRIPEMFDANVLLSLPILLAFNLAPLIYDRFVRRQIERVTHVGTSLQIQADTVKEALSELPPWVSLIEAVLGPGGLGG